jgi:hypothetical protein
MLICTAAKSLEGTTTMAITAHFSSRPGLLSVFRDNLSDTITASRDTARNLLINAGAGKTRRKNGIENCNTRENETARRIPILASAACLVAAVTASLPQPARARHITPPPVPLDLQVDLATNEAFLEGHAVGTQNYICLPTADGFQFMLFTPEATLFDSVDGKQVITHFFSVNPNPSDGGKIRATWQHSKDTSTVWGGNAIPSTDSAFVAPDAIAWLLLPMAGVKNGPKPGDNTLSVTTFIQRLNTSKGLAPSEGCANLNDVGNKAFVPYTADYFFYRKR